MNRRTLSFTSAKPHPVFESTLENWTPPRLHDQLNQWNKESALAEKMADELILLHDSDKEACIDAITYALLSTNWRPGGGAEHGFATAIARFAALGIASLSSGAHQ